LAERGLQGRRCELATSMAARAELWRSGSRKAAAAAGAAPSWRGGCGA